MDTFNPPSQEHALAWSCANQNRKTPSLVAPSDNDTIRASRPVTLVQHYQRCQALQKAEGVKPSSTDQLQCTPTKARLHSSLRRQGRQLARHFLFGPNTLQILFNWPDLPNVCRFFKQILVSQSELFSFCCKIPPTWTCCIEKRLIVTVPADLKSHSAHLKPFIRLLFIVYLNCFWHFQPNGHLIKRLPISASVRHYRHQSDRDSNCMNSGTPDGLAIAPQSALRYMKYWRK